MVVVQKTPPNPALQDPRFKHQPKSPGPGWVEVGKGPRDGLIWKYEGQTAPTPDEPASARAAPPPVESPPPPATPPAPPPQSGKQAETKPEDHGQKEEVEPDSKILYQQASAAVDRHQDKVRTTQFGDLPAINTIIPTAESPLTSQDHTAIADGHTLTAAEFLAQDNEEMAHANIAAAQYHDKMAVGTAQAQQAPTEEEEPSGPTTRVGRIWNALFGKKQLSSASRANIKDPTQSIAVRAFMSGTSTHNLKAGGLGGSYQDTMLTEIMKETDRHGKPHLVSSGEVDRLVNEKGWTPMYRALDKPEQVEQFKSGDLYNGAGIYGNGTYVAKRRAWQSGEEQASKEVEAYGEHRMRMAMPPNARVVSHAALKIEQSLYTSELSRDVQSGKLSMDEYQKMLDIVGDLGRFAALRNYDMIDASSASGTGYCVVLNRSMLAVQKENVNEKEDAITADSRSGGKSSENGIGGVHSEDTRRQSKGNSSTVPVTQDHTQFSSAKEKMTTAGLVPLSKDSKVLQDRFEYEEYGKQITSAAKKAGVFITKDKLPYVGKLSDKESKTEDDGGKDIGGVEHQVYVDEKNNRVYKITRGPYHDGMFGLSRDAHDYLHRMETAAKLWPSLGYQFHGIMDRDAKDPNGKSPVMATSMNKISGTHPTKQEVDDWLNENGWKPHTVSGFRNSWRDTDTGTVISDAHEGNFIKTKSGMVPIDVIIQKDHTTEDATKAEDKEKRLKDIISGKVKTTQEEYQQLFNEVYGAPQPFVDDD